MCAGGKTRMTKDKRFPTVLCMILISILVVCLIPEQVCASQWPAIHDEPAHAAESPDTWIIGSVESPGTFLINGRRARGRETLWTGDMIQVSEDNSARALLDSVGEVLMKRGAVLRVATTTAARDDHTQGRVLVASLVRGEITVKLQ